MPSKPPQPTPAPSAGTSPHPLTFFLTSAERKRALRALARIHEDRARALLILLNDARNPEEKP